MKTNASETSSINQAKQSSTGSIGSRITGMLLILILWPVFAVNWLTAICKRSSVCKRNHRTDALGRKAIIREFKHGFFRQSAVVMQLASGHINLCGVSFSHRLSLPIPKELANNSVPTGLISLVDCQEKTGLSVESPEDLLIKQSQFGPLDNLSLVIRYLFNCLWFRNGGEANRAVLPLFGLQINNTKMDHAIKWFANGEFFRGMPRYCTQLSRPRISFFVNANSINLAQRNIAFKETLGRAHCLFADGSGMRLAAKTSGFKLLDNINGTDVLPLLCKELQQNNKRLFLLGAAPGIAEKVQENLAADYPDLIICGTHHGYFNKAQNQHIITQVNQSKPDVLLVAQGSPLQESWIIENAHQLDCDSVMAVGGLFDFYSGTIPRAPMWMRETGLEWVWRLMQEPVTKFKRYIIGVPEFMFRTFILRQACKE